MKAFREYWSFSAIRGVMSILASIAIFALPQAASSILSLPVLVALAVDCFATFSVFHGAVTILLAKLLPASATRGRVLYAQAGVAAITGVLLYLITYGAVPVRWVLWIASAQAGFAAFAEFTLARDTHREYSCFSCYGTSMVLGVSAFFLPLFQSANATGTSLALATYVGLYGASELFLGGRMLFLEYRADHPAVVEDSEWRKSMLEQSAPQSLSSMSATIACKDCRTCEAEPFCSDYSLDGQVAMLMRGLEPAVVRSVRVVDTIHAAAATQH